MAKIKNHPAAVEFGEKECCALKIAIADATHQESISRFIENANIEEPRNFKKILMEIFTNTARLVFIPEKLSRKFYVCLAIWEKTQLIEGKKELVCGHTIDEHIEALNKVYILMVYPAGSN